MFSILLDLILGPIEIFGLFQSDRVKILILRKSIAKRPPPHESVLATDEDLVRIEEDLEQQRRLGRIDWQWPPGKPPYPAVRRPLGAGEAFALT